MAMVQTAKEMSSCLEGRRPPFDLQRGHSYHVSCLRASSRLPVPFHRIEQCMEGCLNHWRAQWAVPQACRSIVFSDCGWSVYQFPDARLGGWGPYGMINGSSIMRDAAAQWLNRSVAGHTVVPLRAHCKSRAPNDKVARASALFGGACSTDLLRSALIAARERTTQGRVGTVSAVIISDAPRPRPEEEAFLNDVHFRMLFASSPSKVHPKVTAFPYLRLFPTMALTEALKVNQLLPLDQRPNLLLCMCCGELDKMYGRHLKADALAANGLPCQQRRLQLASYHRELAQSQFLFAPHGNGANELKWLEAAALGTIILTDASSMMWPLLSGVPTVMVQSWRNVTPAALHRAAAHISAGMQQRHNSSASTRLQYDYMKSFFPQWLYRVRMGVSETTISSSGERLVRPLPLERFL